MRLGVTVVNQLETDPAGRLDPNAYLNCGAAVGLAIAETLEDAPPGETIPQFLAEETGSATWQGYTYTNQMAGWFTSRGHPAVQSQPLNLAVALAAAVDQGYFAAYLRYWDEANLTGGHFEAIDGYDLAADGTRTWYAMNPYGGLWETFTDARLASLSIGNWVVVVQERKPVPMATEDPAVTFARHLARLANPAIVFNERGAIFVAYVRKCAPYRASGDAVLNPSYWARSETVLPDGSEAFCLLGSGEILHWKQSTGLVYVAEIAEHESIFKKCGW